jgi:hypothetical protein
LIYPAANTGRGEYAAQKASPHAKEGFNAAWTQKKAPIVTMRAE